MHPHELTFTQKVLCGSWPGPGHRYVLLMVFRSFRDYFVVQIYKSVLDEDHVPARERAVKRNQARVRGGLDCVVALIASAHLHVTGSPHGGASYVRADGQTKSD